MGDTRVNLRTNTAPTTGEESRNDVEHTYTVTLSSGDEIFLTPGASPEEAARNAIARWATRYGELAHVIRVTRTGA
jgi:hypothetical protein